MDEDGGKEDKFEFDSTGKSSGYISMAKDGVLAIRTARDEPRNCGISYGGIEMVSERTRQEENRDYYYRLNIQSVVISTIYISLELLNPLA